MSVFTVFASVTGYSVPVYICMPGVTGSVSCISNTSGLYLRSTSTPSVLLPCVSSVIVAVIVSPSFMLAVDGDTDRVAACAKVALVKRSAVMKIVCLNIFLFIVVAGYLICVYYITLYTKNPKYKLTIDFLYKF